MIRTIHIFSPCGLAYVKLELECDEESSRAFDAFAKRRAGGKCKVTGSARMIQDDDDMATTEIAMGIEVRRIEPVAQEDNA